MSLLRIIKHKLRLLRCNLTGHKWIKKHSVFVGKPVNIYVCEHCKKVEPRDANEIVTNSNWMTHISLPTYLIGILTGVIGVGILDIGLRAMDCIAILLY
ncbi:MAG: hypothetical protein K8E24_005365 [Methanobacterium paludis]|nr:hypothetical protein [Methanobacterium paludis]